MTGWEGLGERQRLGDDDVFVVDFPAERDGGKPPLLVLHGFPTSSIDWAAVLPMLRRERRVVLFDFPGYGLSAKPDRPYSLFGQADVAEAVARSCGLGAVDLLTHDMGDSVGGELLARSLDGTLPFSVERRVLTNGSVYIGSAQLSDGQQFLLSLPDEMLAEGPDVAALTEALRGTLAPGAVFDESHLVAAAEAVWRDGGSRLLPRLIRYVEERRVHEGRWTGAIESHPAPLTVVWGVEDPIAVVGMVDRLVERRPDTSVVRLPGVGHYPMIESPSAFADAVLSGL